MPHLIVADIDPAALVARDAGRVVIIVRAGITVPALVAAVNDLVDPRPAVVAS